MKRFNQIKDFYVNIDANKSVNVSTISQLHLEIRISSLGNNTNDSLCSSQFGASATRWRPSPEQRLLSWFWICLSRCECALQTSLPHAIWHH